MTPDEIIAALTAALRDEIAWHEAEVSRLWHPAFKADAKRHRDRIPVLNAALAGCNGGDHVR